MKAKVKRKNRSHQTAKKQKWIPIAVLVIGIILIGVGVISYANGTSSVGAFAAVRINEVFNGAQDVVERTFIVRNVGEAPLTISRVYTTCGCTTAEVSASMIPPGKVATINIIFDAGFHADAAGQTVRRGVIIENNDPNQPKAEIWVQASIRSN